MTLNYRVKLGDNNKYVVVDGDGEFVAEYYGRKIADDKANQLNEKDND
jgi:hypothetical protein